MQLEEQVANLELCKRLKELGVKQESIFSWMKKKDGSIFCSSSYGCDCWIELPYDSDYFCSAFTASELLNIMPYIVDTNENIPFNFYRLRITKSFIVDMDNLKRTFVYIINYWCDTFETGGGEEFIGRHLTKNIYDSNFSNALAIMLIYLIENKLRINV